MHQARELDFSNMITMTFILRYQKFFNLVGTIAWSYWRWHHVQPESASILTLQSWSKAHLSLLDKLTLWLLVSKLPNFTTISFQAQPESFLLARRHARLIFSFKAHLSFLAATARWCYYSLKSRDVAAMIWSRCYDEVLLLWRGIAAMARHCCYGLSRCYGDMLPGVDAMACSRCYC